MYSTILAALDGSPQSRLAANLALDLAGKCGALLIACHVYSARLHKARFMDMEPGLKMEEQDRDFVAGLRQTHDGLIGEGLRALSKGYLDDFVAQAREAGVKVEAAEVEGRNYVKLLETAGERRAGLVALGAQGLGRLEDDLPGGGRLGSVAARVTRFFSGDVLIARQEVSAPLVTVGIDGSPESMAALKQGAGLARLLDGRMEVVAAYDPVFHRQVFQAMAGTLSPDRREEVGLDRQKELHEQIIDDGLGSLYRTFLDLARKEAARMGLTAPARLLQGKAYQALLTHLEEAGSGLVVVGRQGHHREGLDTLGSNTEAVLALARTNVLVAGVGRAREQGDDQPGLEWSPQARARLERIPSGPRSMAQRAVEERVRAQGRNRVEVDDFLALAAEMGMGPPLSPQD